MNIIVNAETLLAAVRGNVAEKKSTAPIMEHVLLDAHGIGECGHLRITSQNASETLATVIKTTNNEECGECTANPLDLMRVLNGLRGEVILALKKTGIEITQHAAQGVRKFTLNTLPADTFPRADEKQQQDLDIDLEALRSAIERVKYCVAKNDPRYYLCGVYLGKNIVAASDGHRAAIVKLAFKFPYELIIPAECLQNVLHIMGIENVRAKVAVSKDNRPTELCLFNGDVSYTTRLIDGRYPDVSQLVPKSVPVSKIELNCRDAAEVIERAIPLEQTVGVDGNQTKFKCSPMVLNFNKKLLHVSGEHVDDFVTCNASDDSSIKLNVRYLADVLRLGKDDDVVMHVFDPRAAGMLMFGANETHLIMPIR